MPKYLIDIQDLTEYYNRVCHTADKDRIQPMEGTKDHGRWQSEASDR